MLYKCFEILEISSNKLTKSSIISLHQEPNELSTWYNFEQYLSSWKYWKISYFAFIAFFILIIATIIAILNQEKLKASKLWIFILIHNIHHKSPYPLITTSFSSFAGWYEKGTKIVQK